MVPPAILETLEKGSLELTGQFLGGSNGTFLVNVSWRDISIRAVYKPSQAERPLWDFMDGTLAHREVAAFQLDRALGWELVPPTVFRSGAPLGPGSLQLFIPHNPDLNYFFLAIEHSEITRKVLLFDYLLNNADRKAGHFILDEGGHVWLIDHGLTFHSEDKLRTVAWDHGGEEIPDPLLVDLGRIHAELCPSGSLYRAIEDHLSLEELKALADRTHSLILGKQYPLPPANRRPVPWPLV